MVDVINQLSRGVILADRLSKTKTLNFTELSKNMHADFVTLKNILRVLQRLGRFR